MHTQMHASVETVSLKGGDNHREITIKLDVRVFMFERRKIKLTSIHFVANASPPSSLFVARIQWNRKTFLNLYTLRLQYIVIDACNIHVFGIAYEFRAEGALGIACDRDYAYLWKKK